MTLPKRNPSINNRVRYPRAMSEAINEPSRRTVRLPASWGLLATATVLVAGTVALFWLAAVPWGPIVCPAIDPMPSHCIPANREGTALVMTALVAAIYAVTMLVGLFTRRMRRVVVGGVVLLAIAPIVGYLIIAWSPGFPLT